MNDRLANTAVEEEGGGGGIMDPPAGFAGVDDEGEGAGAQSSGMLEFGEGATGGLEGVLVVGGLAAPGVPETDMASFCPAWQCLPMVQM